MRFNLILSLYLSSSILFAQEEIVKAEPVSLVKGPIHEESADGYTINYNTVPIIEYIGFASKICKINFIYEETDLDFNITVVSDEPITSKNVMSTLVQVLRIHGLELLEQDNSLVIHKSAGVRQMATLVTEGGEESNAPIVTRIFRVKNAKPDAVGAVIRPMISNSAILETLADTRQLILTDVTGNVDKVAALIENLDSPHTLLDIKSFDAQNNTPEFLIELASQIMNPIAQGNPFILVPQSYANAIFIVSTPELVEKVITVLTKLDTPPKKEIASERRLRGENIFVYKVLNRSGEDVIRGLRSIAQNLQQSGIPEPDLLATIDAAKWIPDSNSVMIIGTKESIDQTKEFLIALDVHSPQNEFSDKASFFVFQPQNKKAEEVKTSILEMAKNLSGTKGGDKSLIETIESVKVNPSTRTLIFSGEEKTFPQVKDMLATIDGTSRGARIPPRNNFFIYPVEKANAEDLQGTLKNFVKNLDKDKAANKGLIDAIGGMKYIQETNSFLFTGLDADLKQLETLLPSFDKTLTHFPASSQFFIHKPKYVLGDHLVSSLKEIATNLRADKLSDPPFLHALESLKWVKSTNSVIFTGDEGSLKKVENLVANLDVENAATAPPGYYIYKVQNASGDIIEDDLELFAKNLKASGVHNQVLEVIGKIRYVKETNSLILSGNPTAIEEVKALIAQYDYPRADSGPKSNFFMYKPQHLQAKQIEKSLHEIASNLKKANLADPSLLQSIETAKYVDSTNSLIFTGSPETLQKLQTLVKDVDVPADALTPIQHVGKTTFLLYKLKTASAPQILSALKTVAGDLKKSPGDKDLVAALSTVKVIKETNSLFFTGSEETLTKLNSLLEKFDVTGLAGPDTGSRAPAATNFFVYRPQVIAGPELEQILSEFSENLKVSGLADPELFNAIASVKWADKTQTLTFTGSPKALDQVKELLVDFDVPAVGIASGGTLEPSIQAIDNVSFLVYKLQFHKGDEIQGALRQIAKDLITTNAPINKGLLNTINSIQWLEVTNSLLVSGDQDTLTRMKELIKNLDVALKQVFIEVLVIETSLTNALSFGLEWGANYKFRNRFAGSTSNTAPPSTTGSDSSTYTPDTLMQNLGALKPPTVPTPQMLPSTGTGAFDLGVIGEVIRHNGDTFLTLGSLLKAIQQDTETSVVDAPKILTQDGKTSTIFVGRNIPFVGSFVQNSTSATISSTNIEYRDIGLNLTITPVLGNAEIVTLDITLDRSQTLSDVTQSSFSSGTTANGIVTSKTTMQTTVHVPDNSFLILSGAVQNSNARYKSGLPCLGGLPLIGAAFSSANDLANNTNIVIFIRPHIINSMNDIKVITEKEEEFFRDQAGTPFLERQFDNNMEIIKTADDD